MKYYHKILGILITITALQACSLSENTKPKMLNAEKNIHSYTSELAALKQKVTIPVLYPKVIPAADKRPYFASLDVTKNQFGIIYQLYIDSTKSCHGTHFCNIGVIEARKATKPTFYKNRNDKDITQEVILAKNIKGYYTPSHAMADMWPTMISWQCNKVSYQISWNLDAKNAKEVIMAMANSAIASGKCE